MKNEIIIDGVTYIRKGYEIGDIFEFSNLDWYIIGKNEHELRLMSKDVVKTMAYSSNNSNDYEESNVKNYLETDFINKLDTSKLMKMVTNYDEGRFSEAFIRIPTLREIEALPMNIRNCGNYYWTMTASYGVSEDCKAAYVFVVYDYGNLNVGSSVYGTLGVRPVITILTETL